MRVARGARQTRRIAMGDAGALGGLFLGLAIVFGAALFVEGLFVVWRDQYRRQLVGLIFAAALTFALQAKLIEGAIARHGA